MVLNCGPLFSEEAKVLVFELVSVKNSFQKQLKNLNFSQKSRLAKSSGFLFKQYKKQRSRQFSKVVVHELPGSL